MPRWARITSVLVAAATVVACGVWAVPAALQKPAMTGVVVSPGNIALEVADQSGPAGRLTVDRVLVPGDSWVVVTTPATDDSPVKIVGAAHVGPGESRGVAVTLDGPVALNQEIVVTLHADRGEIGRFEYDAPRFDASPDKPYYADGVAVSATVVKDTVVPSLAVAAGSSTAQDVQVADGGAVLEVAGRLTVIDQLVVDRVVAPGPAWVAVYLVTAEGAPGALAGHVRVEPGETLGVTVPIGVDVSLTEKLLVVLHADLGTNGVFD